MATMQTDVHFLGVHAAHEAGGSAGRQGWDHQQGGEHANRHLEISASSSLQYGADCIWCSRLQGVL